MEEFRTHDVLQWIIKQRGKNDVLDWVVDTAEKAQKLEAAETELCIECHEAWESVK